MEGALELLRLQLRRLLAAWVGRLMPDNWMGRPIGVATSGVEAAVGDLGWELGRGVDSWTQGLIALYLHFYASCWVLPFFSCPSGLPC